jgi:hypothetical protein
MGLYEKILAALSAKFIKCEDIARILALAIQSERNVLLWGPGGHGKSEMVAAALEVVAKESEIFVQSFGEGLDEAALWGGLDFRALEEEKELRYHPENSFLSKEYAVFEEVFDAPAVVLLALKDTLTARRLRKGNQSYPMRTKVVIGITNRDPDEISEMGPAAAALIERFPLQLRVSWPSYKAADYNSLFAKVAPRLPGADLNGSTGVLAELVAKAGENDSPISPRSAVYALGVVKAAAALRGDGMVHKEDLVDLRFVDGLEGLADNIRQELEQAFERAAAEGRLKEAERKLQALLEEYGAADTPIKCLQAARRFLAYQDEIASLAVTDGLTDRRKSLRETAAAKSAEAQTKALEATRI